MCTHDPVDESSYLVELFSEGRGYLSGWMAWRGGEGRGRRGSCEHIDTHSCTHTYIHMNTYVRTHEHIRTYTCTHTYVHMHTYVRTHMHIHTYAHLLKDGNLLWQCPAHLPNVDSVVGCLVEGLPVGDGHLCRAHAHQDALSSRDTANHTQTGQLCSSQSALSRWR